MVTFKKPEPGRFVSSNGWVIQHVWGWDDHWQVYRDGVPPVGKRWKVFRFHRLDLAKEFVRAN